MQEVTELKIDGRQETVGVQEKATVRADRPMRKVRYTYVVSTIFVTYRKHSRIFELEATDGWFKRFSIGLPYSVITLLLGWWGFPFGIIQTPIAILRNTFGGEDVTFKVEKQTPDTEKFTNNKLQTD